VASLLSSCVIAVKETARSSSPNPHRLSQKEFYEPAVVQTVYLDIADDAWQRMIDALPKRIYVPATFRWRDIKVEQVAVRFKGNSSSQPEQQHKRSFLVKFNEFEDEHRFLGLRRVSFDNGIQFGSLFSEPIVTEILLDLGVKSHRANYARLYLNGEFHGIYVNVERIDETFVEQFLPDRTGSLFKVDNGGPGGNLQFIGDDPEEYRKVFELKSETAEEDLKELVEFIRTVNRPLEDGGENDLAAALDLDSFFKVMPVMLFAGAFDQLTGWNPHNYYLYRDREQDKWLYMPWDLDVGFSDIAFEHIQVLADWNAAWPLPEGRQRPLLERIVSDPVLLERYRASATAVLEKYFEPDSLSRRFDAKYALIKEDLARDPFPQKRVTSPWDEDYSSILEFQKKFVRKRYTAAKQQLQSPGPRPKPSQRPHHEPGPGPASEDAPTDLKAEVRADGIALTWKDNASLEVGHVVQRATEAEREMFRNVMGKPGPNSTVALDTAVQPGEIYRYRVFAVHPSPMGPKGTGISNVITVQFGEKSEGGGCSSGEVTTRRPGKPSRSNTISMVRDELVLIYSWPVLPINRHELLAHRLLIFGPFAPVARFPSRIRRATRNESRHHHSVWHPGTLT
jgi:hypothetical protein